MPGGNERITYMCLQLSSSAGRTIDIDVLTKVLKQPLSHYHDLSLDSRQVTSNSIFIALLAAKKTSSRMNRSTNSTLPTNGHQYIDQAIKMGCTFVITETKQASLNNQIAPIELDQAGAGITQILVFELRRKLGMLAKNFYFNRAKGEVHQPAITAVTGTNGKTSVASLLAQWVSLLGEDSASIGTLGVNLYKQGAFTKVADTINTTPDVVSLYSQLHKFSQQGIRFIALEASSHGLVQNRLANIDVDCGVFTNLSQDHLDYHQTMHAYGNAKKRLLFSSNLKFMVLNAIDSTVHEWQQELAQNASLHMVKVVYFSVQSLPSEASPLANADTTTRVPNVDLSVNKALSCTASSIRYTNQGCEFTLNSSWGNTAISLPLIGKFNVENFLAAASALLVQGYDFKQLIAQAKSLTGVAGRMELFSTNAVHLNMPSDLAKNLENNRPKMPSKNSGRASILVDFAHTPDALQQALIAARAHTNGELVCIFGCGGDRDKTKRELMGEIADRFADKIVLTQDNSRTEMPEKIIADIQNGITSQHKVKVQIDRKQAIIEAWVNSQQNDLILLAGKGHETYIEINHQRIDYDERAFVSALLNNKLEQVELGGRL